MGWHLKYKLVKAYIEGIVSLREVHPKVLVITSEPLINVVAPFNASICQEEMAMQWCQDQFQVTDMLHGYICPELGGTVDLVDILGVNYYYDNQWELGSNKRLCWQNLTEDFRFKPLHQLLQEVYQRYQKPFLITETSHPKEDRPVWIKNIGKECSFILEDGLPLWGICIYPIIDRPDWDDIKIWHESGLWDNLLKNSSNIRELNTPYALALLQTQVLLSGYLNSSSLIAL